MTLSPEHVRSPPAVESTTPAMRRSRVGLAAGAALMTLLAVPYLVALLSPLRLSWDAVVYLSLAQRIGGGGPYGSGESFPPGYPRLLALLDQAGLGAAWAFV